MKKLTLSMLGVLVSTLCFASTPFDFGTSSSYTPYDRYMKPVKQVLGNMNGESPSLEKVRQLMSEGRNFRYSFTEPYTAAMPQVTASLHAGDCKAKSLWLASQLNDPSVRYVIGKARSSSRISHAWLLWKHDSRWYILDCTNVRQPIAVDSINPSKEYIPQYSFAKNGEFRHASAQIVTASNVASRSSSPVASNSWSN
jgi:hypothetical protein